MASKIQIKRGLSANRTSIVPASGELLFTTDDKSVYVGDGSTAGGVPVGRQQYELISTATVSGASTVDFTNLSSAYSQYLVVVTNMGVNRSGGSFVGIRVSHNNGVTFETTSYNFTTLVTSSAPSVDGGGSTSGSEIGLALIYEQAPAYSNIAFSITGAGVAAATTIDGYGATSNASVRFNGRRNVTTAVNAVRIFSASTSPAATFSGTFRLYGIKA